MEENQSNQSLPKRKRILIIGRRGAGKSSLANLLCTGKHWKEDFPVSCQPDSRVDKPTTKPGFSTLCPSLIPEPIEIIDSSGLDNTVSGRLAIERIQSIINTKGDVHGILFVMNFGRCDESDRYVFQLYLQLILGRVPSEMIGIVITRTARQDCLLKNNWDFYRHVDKPETLEKNFEVFCKAMLQRCGKKGMLY